MNPKKRQQQYLVARRAWRGADELPTKERIELLDALAGLLPKKEADVARHAAFCLQQAERLQLDFTGLITDPPPPPARPPRKRAVRRGAPRPR